MAASEKFDIKSILDDVVHQFSDPLAFLRELVQNAIDAGTGEIEIDLEYRPVGGRPSAVITVQDWGEGMNRAIIEDKLLRLFRSGKDEDLTKIGRFGIGFVSVFALEPAHVVVDTGRDGRFWRVVFDSDRTYELFESDDPVEGTRVQIFRPMGEENFRRLRERAEAVVITWCKHARVPLYFCGRDVRQPFDVDSPIKTTYQVEGTQVVMGWSTDLYAEVGYYHRGLTLQERRYRPWLWTIYKIDSRYLEHTLTRDQLLEDGHFSKAMEILKELAEERMPELLIDEMERAAAEGDAELHEHCCRFLAFYLHREQPFRRAWRRRAIFRVGGAKTATPDEITHAMRDGRLYQARHDAELVNWFGDRGMVAIGGEELAKLWLVLTGRAPEILDEQHLFLEDLRRQQSQTTRELTGAVKNLCVRAGFGLDEALMVEANDLSASLRGFWVLSVPHQRAGDGPIEPHAEKMTLRIPAAKALGEGRTLLINGRHDGVRQLLTLVESEPEWAALALLEATCRVDGDSLVVAAASLRQERLLEESHGDR